MRSVLALMFGLSLLQIAAAFLIMPPFFVSLRPQNVSFLAADFGFLLAIVSAGFLVVIARLEDIERLGQRIVGDFDEHDVLRFDASVPAAGARQESRL